MLIQLLTDTVIYIRNIFIKVRSLEPLFGESLRSVLTFRMRFWRNLASYLGRLVRHDL